MSSCSQLLQGVAGYLQVVSSLKVQPEAVVLRPREVVLRSRPVVVVSFHQSRLLILKLSEQGLTQAWHSLGQVEGLLSWEVGILRLLRVQQLHTLHLVVPGLKPTAGPMVGTSRIEASSVLSPHQQAVLGWELHVALGRLKDQPWDVFTGVNSSKGA